jgi:hypothetical protein
MDKIFRLSNGYAVECEWRKTGNGFKHIAYLTKDGAQLLREKVHYLNRTWECFDYQTVAHKVIGRYFKTEAEQKVYIEQVDKIGKGEADNFLKTVSTIAKLGDIFCEKPEEKNQWKKRFISKVEGIDFPEDFDNLPEAEKQKRLDGAINIGLGKGKRQKKG